MQAGAHTGSRRRCQTRVVVTASGTDHQQRRTHPVSAGEDIHPDAKQKSTRFTAMGALTRCSPRSIGHRRPWRNCARARRHSCKQTDAGADVKHARWRQREGPTHRHRRRTLSMPATTFTPAQNKYQHASLRWGDSLAARPVVVAPSDRGGTAPTHACAHTGRHRRRRLRQTGVVATVAKLRLRTQACKHTGRCRRRRKTCVAATLRD